MSEGYVFGAGDILAALQQYEAEQESSGNRSAEYQRAEDRVKNILNARDLTPSQQDLIHQFLLRGRGGPPRKGPGFFSIPTEGRKVNK